MENLIALDKDGKLSISLLLVVGKDEEIFIALAPSLKLSARSKESKEEALTSLESIVKSFFKYYNTHEGLRQELLRLGWDGVQEPEELSIPKNLIENSHETKKFLVEYE